MSGELRMDVMCSRCFRNRRCSTLVVLISSGIFAEGQALYRCLCLTHGFLLMRHRGRELSYSITNCYGVTNLGRDDQKY